VAITISIVTPSLNQGEFLEETIRSVLSQEGDFQTDYLIMDGGSTDNSVEIIKKYEALLAGGQWPVKCCGITYRWRSESDSGQADAINRGFALAAGDIFGWLNSDDILLPGAFQQIAKVDWNKYGFCYGRGRWITREGKEIAEYPTFRPGRYSLQVKCTLCQPTVYFRRETFERLGTVSLEYHLAFDYEYWLRAVFRGERFKRVAALLAESRMYPENKSRANPRAAEWESWQLVKTYYCEVKLHRLLLAIFRFIVERKTRLQEKILFSALGDSTCQ
jgi:glycosyltransferase involved in cell wall biosynthesis